MLPIGFIIFHNYFFSHFQFVFQMFSLIYILIREVFQSVLFFSDWLFFFKIRNFFSQFFNERLSSNLLSQNSGELDFRCKTVTRARKFHVIFIRTFVDSAYQPQVVGLLDVRFGKQMLASPKVSVIFSARFNSFSFIQILGFGFIGIPRIEFRFLVS